MIETKASDLLNAKEIFTKLANTEMSARDCLKVTRTLKAIDNEYTDIQDAQRKTLNKYAVKNEDGTFQTNDEGGIVLEKEHSKDCVNEMNELYSTKITLNCDKISFNVLEKLSLTPTQLISLEDFIDYGD